MLQDLYLFTRGISSFEYDVPIPLQISMYVFVGIILTGSVTSVESSPESPEQDNIIKKRHSRFCTLNFT